ncbi:hypothetical protein [Micromonospora sp. NPDC023737]|uniref:hypothetical protein n=1 Tax=unclassified Micromonospora TaxID=2617518 RepID=UPI0033D97B22
MTFEEYADLARQLAERRRAGDRGVTTAEHRRDLHAAADFLDRRLTGQGTRLDRLGRAIGEPLTVSAPTEVHSASEQSPAAAGGPPAAAAPSPGTGSTGGGAAAPTRPGVGAYAQGPAGSTASAPGVPAPRAAAVDPAVELELARRYADEADRHGHQAELLARRPLLLPAWSPVARAAAVYLASAGAAVVLGFVMVFAAGVGVLGAGTLYAWMCAGLPAVALISGWLALGRWGRAPLAESASARHPALGVAVCFLLVPLVYCGYLFLLRVLP